MTEVLDQPRIERPLPVTIISWILIVSGGFALLSLAYVAEPTFRSIWENLGVNVWGMAIYSVFGGAVQAVAGAAMLKRHVWGRNLYLVFLPLSTLASSYLYGSMAGMVAIPSAVFFAAMLFLLTRPNVNDYFAGTYSIDRDFALALRTVRKNERNKNDLSRVFGFISAGVGAFLSLMCLLFLGIRGETSILMILVVMFGFPALIFVTAGVLLWGRKRWLEVLGGVFAGFGGMGALYGLVMWYMPQTAYWQQVAPNVDPEIFSGFPLVGFLGFGFCVSGILMIRWQLRDDREAARAMLHSR